ncbi:hypothetical protein [Paeniglutamicibacter kerguelensis]|uniref:Cell wall-binding repeat-containing protein n=1 Tax=Paeniglutamicibacter kerguelensis TaxID=254788 RepID=A0ABS4X9N1_9MICC|nr:hypothetical protein [Paeniglutamicibacter kerguelensis]MBP2385174.1 hypothetical protein [Paeniglutamicibacter kerguelensis]
MTIRAKGRLAAAASGLALVLVAAGCTAADPGDDAGARSQGNQDSVVLADPVSEVSRIEGNSEEMALKASQAFFEKTPAVVVLGNDGAEDAAAGQARELGVPLLVAPEDALEDTSDQKAFATELERLGARTLIAHGALSDSLVGGREVVDGSVPDADLPDIDPAGGTTESGFAVVVRSGDKDAEAAGPALATAQAAGADHFTMESPDPRAAKNQEFFQKHAESELYAIGNGFGNAEDFSALAATAAGGKQLPGGGQLVFPDRRMVALYGTPGTSSLGLLGEQDVDAAIKLAKKYAAEYQPHSKEKVQPAFEIIATVASASAGDDGKYSSYVPVERLEPWVKAAEAAGVYVVLDLQPGRNDFLTQAKRYEKLLSYPNVGIAYDPEWRLKPNQRHMVQIGSVDAAELNRANDWLAELTREHQLPQKVVILHQFTQSMIRNRSTLDTSHPELAMVVHADGHGSPGMKMGTWENLRRDLPDGIRMAWKNFIDEDSPTFTPEQTFDIDPKPWFVSYQ